MTPPLRMANYSFPFESAADQHADGNCSRWEIVANSHVDIMIHNPPCQHFISPFMYHPVDNQWQIITCTNLGLRYVGPNRVTPGGLHVPLTLPASIRSICGDGNCLFRSFAYIITGSEEDHLRIRQAIVEHATVIAHLLRHYLGMTEHQMDQYLANNYMGYSGTWGTDLEMSTLSHLLGICV